MIGQHTSYGRVRYSLVTSAGGYLPTGYLPTGYLPTGYLPIGAAATGGGSLRGKSAAAATLSMATSPAVTIMMIFMMLIPLCLAPGQADRVTPLFRFVCARRPLLPSHVPAQSPGGNGSRLFVALAGRMVQMRLGGSGKDAD